MSISPSVDLLHLFHLYFFSIFSTNLFSFFPLSACMAVWVPFYVLEALVSDKVQGGFLQS